MAIAGRKAQVRVSGAPVAFTGEPTTPNAARTEFRITDTARALWDPAAALTVRRSTDGTTYNAVPAAEYTLNRLTGTVAFAAAQAPGVLIQVSGASLTLSVAGEAKEFSYTLTNNTTEASRFGDSHVRRATVLRDASGSLSQWSSVDRYFENALTAGTPVVLDFYSDASAAAPDLRAWAILSKAEMKAAVDGLAETSVEWEGTPDNEGRTITLG